MEIFDIYLAEAIVNGLLFGGILALLSLGLNLVFGVIDVVWICYAELVMFGMYTIYYLYMSYSFSIIFSAIAAIIVVSALGFLVHILVISPIITSTPINQLLATGGLMFFLQSLAVVMFGIDFRNIGLKLPILEINEMFFSFARLISFIIALIGMGVLYLFLNHTFMGKAIRAIAQDREIMVLMGINIKKVYIWIGDGCKKNCKSLEISKKIV